MIEIEFDPLSFHLISLICFHNIPFFDFSKIKIIINSFLQLILLGH